MTAACSAREETSYVSNERAMLRAACSAVAHSPFAGGFVQLSDLGATCRIWSGVRVVDGLRGAGVAVDRVDRVRVIKVNVNSVVCILTVTLCNCRVLVMREMKEKGDEAFL